MTDTAVKAFSGIRRLLALPSFTPNADASQYTQKMIQAMAMTVLRACMPPSDPRPLSHALPADRLETLAVSASWTRVNRHADCLGDFFYELARSFELMLNSAPDDQADSAATFRID